MDLHTLLVTIHLLGFAFGVGGATASDLIFLRTVKDGNVTRDEFNIIKTVSGVVWASVTLLILSGLALMLFEQIQTGSVPRLGRSFFQMKMTAFAILVVNGIVFHKRVFPILKGSIGGSFFDDEIRKRYWLFGLTGGISIVSWYSAFLLVAFSRFLVDYPYLLLLNVYALLVVGAAVSAYFVLNLHANGKGGLVKRLEKIALRTGLALLVLGVLFGLYQAADTVGFFTQTGMVHEISTPFNAGDNFIRNR